MTHAALYGFVVTALAQGLIAGIGYLLIGLEAPALLGALTGVFSVFPLFGTTIVWGPQCQALADGPHVARRHFAHLGYGIDTPHRHCAASVADQQRSSSSFPLSDARCIGRTRGVWIGRRLHRPRAAWRHRSDTARMGGKDGHGQ